jgi:CRP/FNR family cyclic AMP-dependent transcriptional regulator
MTGHSAQHYPKANETARQRKKAFPATATETLGLSSKLVQTAPDELEKAVAYPKGQAVFSQGEEADAVFYIGSGRVKLSVVSSAGKEAVIGIFGPGDFIGEGCLTGQSPRTLTAVAVCECSIVRLEKAAVARLLRNEPWFSGLFISYLLSRNARVEEDLIDHLFNSSEKRLARVLLLLANSADDGHPEQISIHITHETLAGMIGTTRPRVSFFMNKFREHGLISYDDHELTINSSLLRGVLHDSQDSRPLSNFEQTRDEVAVMLDSSLLPADLAAPGYGCAPMGVRP